MQVFKGAKWTIQPCTGQRLLTVWVCKSNFFGCPAHYAVMDEFGTLVKVEPKQTSFSLGEGA